MEKNDGFERMRVFSYPSVTPFLSRSPPNVSPSTVIPELAVFWNDHNPELSDKYVP